MSRRWQAGRALTYWLTISDETLRELTGDDIEVPGSAPVALAFEI